MKFQKDVGLAETLERLNQRIEKLEQSIQQMSKPIIEHVTIERVYVQNPVLERLEFGLDKLDIKELSGALNLGNNFGVAVEQLSGRKKGTEPKKGEHAPKAPNETNESEKMIKEDRSNSKSNNFGMERTDSGYRFKVNQNGSS